MHNMNILLINCPSALGIYSTMQQQRKCILTWDRYSDHLREAFKEMMTSSEFADVTLVTDDKQQINAHRNILSACSPVFKNILKLNSGYNNPVIYLRGIQHLEMESIIKFIYLGEARISEEKLADFLTVSKNLEIEELSTVTVIKDQNAFKSEIDDHYATDEKDVAEDPAQTFNEDDSITKHQAQISTEASNQLKRNNAENREVDGIERYARYKYVCNQCDFKAAKKGNMTKHIQSRHEGMKYACNQCDYKTRKHSSLTVHIESRHEGVKYACYQCDYQATQQSSLKVHIQAKHEGIKYACNQCDYQGTRPHYLTRHIQSNHEV